MMNGLKKHNKTLRERGLKNDSFFHARFKDKDKTEAKEHDYSWQDMSTLTRVNYQGGTKSVFLCNLIVKDITITHEGQQIQVNVPDDCQVYQAVRSETLFTPSGARTSKILGRVVGLVKNGEVIEEYFINGMQRNILGFRK